MSDLLRRAKALRWAERLPQAERLYRRAYARDPSPERALYLAECLMRRGRTGQVLALLKRAAQTAPPPRRAEELVRRYRLALMSLDFEGARREGAALLRRSRATRDVEELCWMIFMDEFPFARRPAHYVRLALAGLDRFIAREPRSPWGYYWRGLTRELAPRGAAAARADLKRAAGLARGRMAWMNYRWALETRSPALLKAVVRATKPGSWKAQAVLVETLIVSGQTRAAARELKKLRRLIPSPRAPGNGVEARGYLARLHLMLGKPREALRAAAPGAALDSRAALLWTGAALARLGRLAEGLRLIEAAAALARNNPTDPARAWAKALRRGREPRNRYAYPSLDETLWLAARGG